jgi:hypothetical protein
MFSHLLSVVVYIFKYFFYTFFTPVFTTYQNNFFLLQNVPQIFDKICTFLFLQFSHMG